MSWRGWRNNGSGPASGDCMTAFAHNLGTEVTPGSRPSTWRSSNGAHRRSTTRIPAAPILVSMNPARRAPMRPLPGRTAPSLACHQTSLPERRQQLTGQGADGLDDGVESVCHLALQCATSTSTKTLSTKFLTNSKSALLGLYPRIGCMTRFRIPLRAVRSERKLFLLDATFLGRP